MNQELDSEVTKIEETFKDKEAYCFGCGSNIKNSHLLICAECLGIETDTFLKLAEGISGNILISLEEDE